MEGELDFEDEVNNEDKRKDSLENSELENAEVKDKLDSQGDDAEEPSTENAEEGEETKKEKLDESIEEGEDDGEITDDDDLEEGEVKDVTPAPKQQTRQAAVCRFFNRGQCTWGSSCRFLHLSVSERGNYNMFGPPARYPPYVASNVSPNIQIVPQRSGNRPAPDFLPGPPPPMPPPVEPSPVETAWERGLRQAKELVKKANKRKEEEPDFEDKRLNLSIDINEKNSPDYDKENEYFDKPYKRQNDMHSYKYDESDPFDNEDRTAREHWRGGRYENFEIRWTRDDIGDQRRERSRGRRVSVDRERDKFSKHGRNKERWRDDRLFEVQHSGNRTRADDWVDPWRRSKTPKTGGRQTRSRSGSYSSVSSYSYSDRSSRSSYSYSRSSSSSRSSRSPSVLQKRKVSPPAENLSPKGGSNRFSTVKKKSGPRNSRYASYIRSHSSRSRSRLRSSSSRSLSRTPSVSRSRSYSRSLSMDSVSSASSSVSHSSSASESIGIRNAHPSILRRSDKPSIEKSDSKRGTTSLYEEMQKHVPQQESLKRKGDKLSVEKSDSKRGTTSLYEEMQRHVQRQENLRRKGDKPSTEKSDSKGGTNSLYEEIQRYARHDKANNSLSTNEREMNSAPAPESTAPEMTGVPSIHHLLPSMDKKEPVKGLHKQQIKLTLLNKPPPAKLMNFPKKEIESIKNESSKIDTPTQSGTKRPLSPSPVASAKVAATPTTPKKSASSRRDELLKQLKAVEDAIARKRAKIC
ncbi:zinc finger CCCH domain-containing protein 18-like isoform X1 [Uloborus diversus]|uniref:zinc finger CCCH domain-containing protein 18-like isoform X1 n=1 Tax=Uloborus diversus TaxID=327109 RepID=UPI002409C44B|nr:zinc finger CCCH domain-containing protein 18-like isoform X1 [Uloborus diversus]